jgi:hypothetical protein
MDYDRTAFPHRKAAAPIAPRLDVKTTISAVLKGAGQPGAVAALADTAD